MKTTKTLLVAVVLLIANFGYSQSYKLLYEMSWKSTPDTIGTHNELCALVVNEGEPSIFQSYVNFRQDSMKTKIILDYEKNGRQRPLRIPSSSKPSLFRQTIMKDVAKGETIQEEKFYTKTLAVKSYKPIKWNIEKSEPITFFGYNAQKATCEFGGRKWTAIFTQEIPISEGPYKFYGLPGLILKISDDAGHYSFEIKGVSKESNKLILRYFGDSEPAYINCKEWNKFYKNYAKQPSMVFENLNTEQTTYVYQGLDVATKEAKKLYDEKGMEIPRVVPKKPNRTKQCMRK